MNNPKPYKKVTVHSISESVQIFETFSYMVTTKRYQQTGTQLANTYEEQTKWLNTHCKYNWYIVNNFPDKNMLVYMFRFPEDATAFKIRFVI